MKAIGKFLQHRVGTLVSLKSKAMRFFFIIVFLLSNVVFAQGTPDPLLVKDVKAQNQWVDSLYKTMPLEEKIGQLFMVMVFSEKGEAHYQAIEEQIATYHLGGLIFSLGGPQAQRNWTERLQKKAKVPLLIGMDAEWGVAMRLDSVPAFPWNMTLGATQDKKLVAAIGQRIGEQAHRLGVHINFAPSVDLNTNPKNPIIGNRAFGEDPIQVAEMGKAFMQGMHTGGVLSSAKHFPGHGDTSKDSHYDLPVIQFDRLRLENVELYPFKEMIQAGVSSVMVAHLNVPALDEGTPSSMSKVIVQEQLKKALDFKGLIITDALNMGAATELKGIGSVDLAAFLAGNDILLIPNDIKKAVRRLTRAYKQGKFSEERLAQSVKKILKAKYKVGLHNDFEAAPENLMSELVTPKDHYLIQTAHEKALTLLKGEAELPLGKDTTYGFLSLGDDDGTPFRTALQNEINLVPIAAKQSNAEILEAAKPYQKIIVGFHRSNANPWKASGFSAKEKALLTALSAKHEVILNVFVKPYALSSLPALPQIKTILLGYQNHASAQGGAAKALLGKIDIQGQLPVTIHPDFPVGLGIKVHQLPKKLEKASPIEVGMDKDKLQEINALGKQIIDSMMTPGFQILASRYGKIFYQGAFGYHTYKQERKVKNTDVYDLASLTKILATLPLGMQAHETGVLPLEKQLGTLSPLFKESNKADIVLQDMLSHHAGLVAWIPFYEHTLKMKSGKLHRKYYRNRRTKQYTIPVAKKVFAHPRAVAEQEKALLASPLLDSLRYKYSDLGFLFYQTLLEEKYSLPLDQLFTERIKNPMGLKHITFRPLSVFPKENIVPSEEDNYFRKQKLQGYVHDMAAALKGGVAGHAGLFGNAEDVAQVMQMYLQKGQYGEATLFSPATFDRFNQCLFCAENNRRGIGFDKPQAGGGGMTFEGISPESFGHGGFTGTYAWADPETQIVFVFLSNRTFPSAENRKLITENVRTRMQALLYEAILY